MLVLTISPDGRYKMRYLYWWRFSRSPEAALPLSSIVLFVLIPYLYSLKRLLGRALASYRYYTCQLIFSHFA